LPRRNNTSSPCLTEHGQNSASLWGAWAAQHQSHPGPVNRQTPSHTHRPRASRMEPGGLYFTSSTGDCEAHWHGLALSCGTEDHCTHALHRVYLQPWCGHQSGLTMPGAADKASGTGLGREPVTHSKYPYRMSILVLQRPHNPGSALTFEKGHSHHLSSPRSLYLRGLSLLISTAGDLNTHFASHIREGPCSPAGVLQTRKKMMCFLGLGLFS
jgi:hypothetical protein